MNINKESRLYKIQNPLNIASYNKIEGSWYPWLTTHVPRLVKHQEEFFPLEEVSSISITHYLRTTSVKNITTRRSLKVALMKYFDERMRYDIYKSKVDRGQNPDMRGFEMYDLHTVPKAIRKVYKDVPVTTFLMLPFASLGVNTDFVKINGLGQVLYNNTHILRHENGYVKLSGKKVSVGYLLTMVLELDVERCSYIQKGGK